MSHVAEAIVGLIGGLAGVLLGWVLGFWATPRTEQEEARRAAALVLGELAMNKMDLGGVHSAGDFDPMKPLRREAWDTHGIVLMRILRGGPLTDVYGAYASLNYLDHSKSWLRTEYTKAVEAIEDAKRQGDIETVDQAEWLKSKGEMAKRAKEGLEDLAAKVPESFLPDVERAITALSRYRPFED